MTFQCFATCPLTTRFQFALSWFITWDLWLWSIIDYVDWLSCPTTRHLLVLQGLWYISINDTSCKSFNNSSLSNSWLANDDLKQQGGSGIAWTEGTLPGMMSSMLIWCIFGQKNNRRKSREVETSGLTLPIYIAERTSSIQAGNWIILRSSCQDLDHLKSTSWALQSCKAWKNTLEKHFSCIRSSTRKSLFELSWTISFFSYPFHVFHLFPSNSSDLIISANHWVQLPFPRHAGKICPIGLEGFIRALRVLARDLGRSKIMYVSTAQQKSPGKHSKKSYNIRPPFISCLLLQKKLCVAVCNLKVRYSLAESWGTLLLPRTSSMAAFNRASSQPDSEKNRFP